MRRRWCQIAVEAERHAAALGDPSPSSAAGSFVDGESSATEWGYRLYRETQESRDRCGNRTDSTYSEGPSKTLPPTTTRTRKKTGLDNQSPTPQFHLVAWRWKHMSGYMHVSGVQNADAESDLVGDCYRWHCSSNAPPANDIDAEVALRWPHPFFYNTFEKHEDFSRWSFVHFQCVISHIISHILWFCIVHAKRGKWVPFELNMDINFSSLSSAAKLPKAYKWNSDEEKIFFWFYFSFFLFALRWGSNSKQT